MATSLATQLASIASRNPDAAKLQSARTLRQRESYLFGPKQAAAQSLDDVYTLGVGGLEGLVGLDPSFEEFRAPLFGEAARRLDRTLLPRDEVDKLDNILESFLKAVGPHVLVRPSACALEWLIRRFRINEFNVPAVAATFLPFYATPQFASMLHTLHLDNYPQLSWLQAVKETRDPMPHQHLVDALVKSTEALRYVAAILPSTLSTSPQYAHRALVGFHLSTLLGVFDALATRSKRRDPGFGPSVSAIVLPALRSGVKATGEADVQLASYVLVAAFAQRSRPGPDAVAALVKLVAHSRPKSPALESRMLDGGWTDCDEALVRALVVLCQSSPEPESLQLTPKSAAALLGIPNLDALLAAIAARFDIGPFWRAFTRALIDGTHAGIEGQQEVLLRFARSTSLRADLAESLLDSLLVALTALKGDDGIEGLVDMLRPLAQRHPAALDASARHLMRSMRPEEKRVIEQAVRFATLGDGASRAVALHSASDVVRSGALADIFESSTADSDEILTAAVRLLADPSPASAGLLQSHANTIASRLSAEQIGALLKAGRQALVAGEDVARATLRAHLEFFCTAVAQHPGAIAAQIALELVLPRLVVTKSTAKASAVAWDVIVESNRRAWTGTVLDGVQECRPEGEGWRTNERVAEQVAAWIAKSGARLEDIWRGCWGASAGGRLLALLIQRALASRLTRSTEETIQVIDLLLGSDVLDVLVDSGEKRRVVADIPPEDIKSEEILHAVHKKTSSPRTLLRVGAAALLILVDRLAAPKDQSFTWFADRGNFETTVHNLFRLAGAGVGSSPGTVGAELMGSLARNVLATDALAFFANAWTRPLDSEGTRCAALRQACSVAIDCNKDPQLVIPSALVALQDGSRAVREAALRLLTALAKAYESPSNEVYGYGAFYGERRSVPLQYLGSTEAAELIGAILAAREECLFSSTAIERVLEDQLSAIDAAAGRKASSGLKHKALCFILANVECLLDVELRCRMLKVTTKIKDPLKIEATAPLIEAVLEGKVGGGAAAQVLEEYAQLLMLCYVKPSKNFSKNAERGYSLFLRVVESADPAQTPLRNAAFARLRGGLAQHLNAEQQTELLYKLIQIGTSERSDAAAYIGALSALATEMSPFIALLNRLTSDFGEARTRSQKRFRTSTGAATNEAPPLRNLIELSLLLENVPVGSLDATPDLIVALIATLKMLNDASASAFADTQFAAQLVVSALVELAPKARDRVDFDATAVQLGPVIDYMRMCPNPYLAQQAIVFIAELAPAAPDQVLQSVMPVFTFVGSNVLQRDDSSSVRTVQKVIDALVPPLLAAAQENGDGDRISTIRGLRELLLAFVDASGHIPRHRRLRLFTRLVKALGPYNFLAAAILLLLDQNPASSTEVHADLSLALWESFPADLGIAALAHILSEIESLMQRAEGSGGDSILPDKERLDPDEDIIMADGPSSITVSAERISRCLDFVKSALGSRSLASKLDSDRSSDKLGSDAVLAHFLQLTAELLQKSADDAGDLMVTAESAREIAHAAAQLISVDALSLAVSRLLESDSSQRIAHGLDILRARLPSLKSARRLQLEPAIRLAISSCAHQVQQAVSDAATPGPDLLLGLETLSAILASPSSAEVNASASMLPLLLKLTSSANEKIAVGGLMVAKDLGAHLGARIIPYLGMVVQTSSSLILSAKSTPADVLRACFGLLEVLSRVSASYLRTHLPTLVSLVIAEWTHLGPKQSGVAEAKRAYTSSLIKANKCGDLIPIVTKLWQTAENFKTQQAVLDFLRRVIKHASPSEIVPAAKSTFLSLLQVLDLRSSASMDSKHLHVLETAALDAYTVLVLKLNERTFKPLLFRTIDWAVIEPSKHDSRTRLSRLIVLFRLYHRLLTSLKSLALPFVESILDPLAATLDVLLAQEEATVDLWDEAIAVLAKSLEHDSIGFWTRERLSKVVEPATKQLSLTSKLPVGRIRDQLVPLLGRLSSAVGPHDDLLKIFNGGVLRAVRDDDPRIKRVGIAALDAAWRHLGTALVPFIPETVGGGLAEALEEPEAGVDNAAKALLKRIEGELGGESIDAYLA